MRNINISYFRTSAKTGEGVADAFLELAGKMASSCEDENACQ